MGSGSTAHITSNRNNRSLQKGGRRSFFKERKLKSSEARGNASLIDISIKRTLKANAKKSRLEYIQRGIIFLVFLGLWWFVYNL